MDDVAAAVRDLLGRWRGGRQPEVAAALEATSARITRPPIAGKTFKARQEAWLACAAEGDPADTPRLVATLTEGSVGEGVQARVEALTARGPDPRAAAALAAIVVQQQLFVTKPRFWRAVLDGLTRMGDPRQAAVVKQAIPRHEPPEEQRYQGYVQFSIRRFLWDRLPPLVRLLERIVVAPLSPEERAALAALARPTAAARTEAELLDAVLADPGDDAPRLVLADALQARGDARGELIALQIARGRGGKVSAREKALVKALRAELLGPLAPVVQDPVFERGFLAGCHARFSEADLALCAHPWWRTAESLATDAVELLRRRDLPVLRRIAPGRALDEVLAGDPLPGIAALELTSPQLRRHATALAGSRALPDLRELLVEEINRTPLMPEMVVPILRGPLGKGLEELVIRVDRFDLHVDRWRALTPRPVVRFEKPGLTARLVGDTLEAELRSKSAVHYLRRGDGVVVIKAPKGTDLEGFQVRA
jgi:uncharacterized protein (TIGR02996 family)